MGLKIFSDTNIEEQLKQIRSKDLNELFSKTYLSKTKLNQFNIDDLERDRIFHVQDIKKTCIDYRLRFLDSRYFKNKIPQAAFDEINRLNSLHNTRLGGYKIMAPSKLFKLKDYDDPLLFAPIGNGYYYLIHKWGKRPSPLQKIFDVAFQVNFKFICTNSFIKLGCNFNNPNPIVFKIK